MNNKFVRDYTTALSQRIKDESEALVYGNAQNMKDYGTACGRIQALRESLQDFQQLWEEFVRKGGEGEEIFGNLK